MKKAGIFTLILAVGLTSGCGAKEQVEELQDKTKTVIQEDILLQPRIEQIKEDLTDIDNILNQDIDDFEKLEEELSK